MEMFDDKYGGRDIERAEFSERWDALVATPPSIALVDAIADGLALVSSPDQASTPLQTSCAAAAGDATTGGGC
jgi:hypothetical protein